MVEMRRPNRRKEDKDISPLSKSWVPFVGTCITTLFVVAPLNYGRLNLWGHQVANFQVPSIFLGHSYDAAYPIILGLLSLKLAKKKRSIWETPVEMFLAFSTWELAQGIGGSPGFDYKDFAAYAVGSLALAGIDALARKIQTKRS